MTEDDMTDLRHQVPPRDEDYPPKAQVPLGAPDRIWIEDEIGEGHEDQWSYGSWDCRCAYDYVYPYLLATPARERADELVEALREIAYGDIRVVGELVQIARAALAKIEEQTKAAQERGDG